MKTFPSLLIAGITLLIFSGCGPNYRVGSVINTEHPSTTTWKATTGNIQGEHQIYINPYTFNPNDPDAYGLMLVLNQPRSGPPAYIYGLENKSSWVSGGFSNWLSAATNAIFADCVDNTANFARYKMVLEVFAPLYWKASESTNITGLTDEDRRYYRNDLQNAMFQVIKESTEQHLAGLKSTENNFNLLLGGATIGLAGGAAVASAESAKALAASASGTAGMQSLINSQLYRNTFVEAMIALIENDQATFLAGVKTNQTRSIYDYTMEAAIADAKEYEARGSFYHGLALLQEAVQNKINGGSNIVSITQYAPVIVSPTILPINIATNQLYKTNSFTIIGHGFGQLDLGSLNNFSNEVFRVIGGPSVNSDQSVGIILCNTATTSTTGTLPLPLRNDQGSLGLPVSITVTNQ